MVDRDKQFIINIGISKLKANGIGKIHRTTLNIHDIVSTIEIFNNFCFLP